MTGQGQDLRHAFRLLRQQPGFTAVALLTLALGIGATTAIFSVVNAVVLRPLPFPQSDRLVLLYENNMKRGWATFSVAPANYADWARDARGFESMVAMNNGTAALFADGTAEQVPTTFATAELFPVFRGRPAHGRAFVPGDDTPGAPPVAVIGHGLWRRRFGGDPAIVGRVVTINDRPTTIVGVMEQGFGRGTTRHGSLAAADDRPRPRRARRADAGGDGPAGGRRRRRCGARGDGSDREPARAQLPRRERRMGRDADPSRRCGGRHRREAGPVRAAGRRRVRAADRVRQRRQSAVGARRRAAARAGDSGGARRRPAGGWFVSCSSRARRWRRSAACSGCSLPMWGTEVLLALAPPAIPRSRRSASTDACSRGRPGGDACRGAAVRPGAGAAVERARDRMKR